MSRKSNHSPIAFIFLIVCAVLGFGLTPCRAEDRRNIDPNTETVLVTVGDVDFDIPLGYFYEKTVWTRGVWPRPNPTRTVNNDLVIVAHLNGMRPWSPELDAAFKSGAQTTRISVRGDYGPYWLENFLKYRSATIAVATTKAAVPGLTAYTSSYAKNEILYLKNYASKKPYFRMRCADDPIIVKCEVMFDYAKALVVSYDIPTSSIAEWQRIHASVVSLLNQLKTH